MQSFAGHEMINSASPWRHAVMICWAASSALTESRGMEIRLQGRTVLITGGSPDWGWYYSARICP